MVLNNTKSKKYDRYMVSWTGPMQLEIIVNNFVTLSARLCYHEVHVLTSCVYRCVIFHKLNTDCQWFFLVFPVAIFLIQEMNWDTTCITFSCLCCTGKQKHSCSTWLCTLLGVWITFWVWKLKASQANVSEVWIETAKSCCTFLNWTKKRSDN